MTHYTAREEMHARYCRDDMCMIDYDVPGKSCLSMDFLITLVEIDVLDNLNKKPSEPEPPLNTVARVWKFAEQAHAGQTDKLGAPYFEHVRAVAMGLTDFGADLVMAGLLHDVLEDTAWTAADLNRLGLPPRVLRAVQAVTNVPGETYQDKIKGLLGNPDAVLVKIADNAHNSRADRLAQLEPKTRQRLEGKYDQARPVLWGAAPAGSVRRIVEVVNPALLGE